MIYDLAAALTALTLSPLVLAIVFVALRRPFRAHDFFSRWAVGDAGATLFSALKGDWRNALAWGLSGLLALALWWFSRRRKRRRALRQLGHKARAALAAMARNMPRPGPVLRPVPQGSPS